MGDDLDLDSPAVTGWYKSSDSQNFAVDVSIADYSTAFGLPSTDAQNVFYGMDPSRRVILIFSYGHFDWPLSGDFAAQPIASAAQEQRYRVGMGALAARTGSVMFEQTPACK